MTRQTVKVTGLQEALDSLTVFQRARIPGSTAWALNQFAVWLRQHEQQRIPYTFNKTNAFTRNAPLFKLATKENPSVLFFLRDNAPGGNSPDRYLYPQVASGFVYVTRFSRALQRSGAIRQGQTPETGDYVLHWDQGAPKATPGFISAIKSALTRSIGPARSGAQYARNLRSANKFFILGKERSTTRTYRQPGRPRKDTGYKGYGIYTRKGGRLDLVYPILRRAPKVPAKYDWNETRMASLAEDKIPIFLFSKLSEF
jgi:hypothetical protein